MLLSSGPVKPPFAITQASALPPICSEMRPIEMVQSKFLPLPALIRSDPPTISTSGLLNTIKLLLVLILFSSYARLISRITSVVMTHAAFLEEELGSLSLSPMGLEAV